MRLYGISPIAMSLGDCMWLKGKTGGRGNFGELPRHSSIRSEDAELERSNDSYGISATAERAARHWNSKVVRQRLEWSGMERACIFKRV